MATKDSENEEKAQLYQITFTREIVYIIMSQSWQASMDLLACNEGIGLGMVSEIVKGSPLHQKCPKNNFLTMPLLFEYEYIELIWPYTKFNCLLEKKERNIHNAKRHACKLSVNIFSI